MYDSWCYAQKLDCLLLRSSIPTLSLAFIETGPSWSVYVHCNINRSDLKIDCTKFVRICSLHFVDGRPSDLHPYPTVNLGYEDKKVAEKKGRRMNLNFCFASTLLFLLSLIVRLSVYSKFHVYFLLMLSHVAQSMCDMHTHQLLFHFILNVLIQFLCYILCFETCRSREVIPTLVYLSKL